MNTYDDAAFERFCSGLVNQGFSPVRNTQQKEWIGPIRSSLQPFTDAASMKIIFYEGWPFSYAHVCVDGLHTEHAARGVICLWADDDPAQIAGRDLDALWKRVDEWANAAQEEFHTEDNALDAYLLFYDLTGYNAELPIGNLISRGNNGYIAALTAVKRGANALIIELNNIPRPEGGGQPCLKGAFYLRGRIGQPPRSLKDIRDALTRRQAQDLERGLADRGSVGLAEPSGGYDFIVLAWPRHGSDHDALVVGFDGQDDSLQAFAMAATPNDTDARKRRAGPDADLLGDKIVLVAGVGSVGGHVAVTLASSGVGTIRLRDDDHLKSVNLVRHVCSDSAVGYPKTVGVSVTIDDHAPWTEVKIDKALSLNPEILTEQIDGVNLVVDCSGNFALSAALAEVCLRQNLPLITGALYHAGAVCRIQRQAEDDTPIAGRSKNPAYLDLPPEDPRVPQRGFLELGCMAPVNNTSPIAVLSTAAEISHIAVDFLTERRQLPDERIVVFRPLQPPLDRTGTIDGPCRGTDDST